MRMRKLSHSVSALLVASAMATSFTASADDSKLSPTLLNKINTPTTTMEVDAPADTFRVHVHFDTVSAPKLSKEVFQSKEAFKAFIADVKESVRFGVRRLPVHLQDKVTYQFKAQNSFSAVWTAEEIREASDYAHVEYIEDQPELYKTDVESHELTQLNVVHDMDGKGQGAVIAIIDDGIDHDHAAFGGQSSFPNDKILGGYDFADNDSDPTTDCSTQDHGTAVAGVAAGNSSRIQGAAPEAQIVFYKIQSARICGQSGLDGDIAAALDQALSDSDRYGIDIVSMSLGTSTAYTSACDRSASRAWGDAIDNLTEAGIAVFVASGNDGYCDRMSAPACFSNAISVGATYDEDGRRFEGCVRNASCQQGSSSSRCPSGYKLYSVVSAAGGVTPYSNTADFLDVFAPAHCAETAEGGGGVESCFTGTSSATPYAAGVAAVMVGRAGKGTLSPSELKSVLTDFGTDNTDPKVDITKPLLNALASYDSLDPAAVNANFSFDCDALTCTFNASSSVGSIESYSWDFGDGSTGTGISVTHEYDAEGTYDVSLTVSDGTTDDTETKAVEASVVTTPDITVDLSRGGFWFWAYVRVEWEGATTDDVDIYFNDDLLVNTANDGQYDHSGNHSGTYLVCNEGGYPDNCGTATIN